jgi:hypothetical protein
VRQPGRWLLWVISGRLQHKHPNVRFWAHTGHSERVSIEGMNGTSAFTRSGHSNRAQSPILNGCFRPKADIRASRVRLAQGNNRASHYEYVDSQHSRWQTFAQSRIQDVRHRSHRRQRCRRLRKTPGAVHHQVGEQGSFPTDF